MPPLSRILPDLTLPLGQVRPGQVFRNRLARGRLWSRRALPRGVRRELPASPRPSEHRPAPQSTAPPLRAPPRASSMPGVGRRTSSRAARRAELAGREGCGWVALATGGWARAEPLESRDPSGRCARGFRGLRVVRLLPGGGQAWKERAGKTTRERGVEAEERGLGRKEGVQRLRPCRARGAVQGVPERGEEDEGRRARKEGAGKRRRRKKQRGGPPGKAGFVESHH